MAINVRRTLTIAEARLRRSRLPRYLELDGSRYLLAALVLLCLVSLLSLWQTGVVTTRGYALSRLQQERTELLRERAQLELRLAAASSLTRIEQLAQDRLNMQVVTPDQLRYINITVPPVASAPADPEPVEVSER